MYVTEQVYNAHLEPVRVHWPYCRTGKS